MNIKLLVDGGAMKPGPALSQKLGPAGVPINDVIAKVNEATEGFKGMKVPVEIEVDTKTKGFDIEVSSPPISELLKKEAGIPKGSGYQGKLNSGNLSIEQVIKIAKTKMPGLLCNNLKTAVKTTAGSCATIGLLVESKPATQIGYDIDEGIYDEQINNEVTETPAEKKEELDNYFKTLKAAQDAKFQPSEDDAGKKKK